MIKGALSLITLIGAIFFGFWYGHEYAYAWYTIPVELSIAGGWVLVWGILFK